MVEATDAREAYRLAIEHKPDIALLDVDMPDLDVGSVTKLVRKQLPNSECCCWLGMMRTAGLSQPCKLEPSATS